MCGIRIIMVQTCRPKKLLEASITRWQEVFKWVFQHCFVFISKSTHYNLICGLYKAFLAHDNLLMNLISTRKVKVVLQNMMEEPSFFCRILHPFNRARYLKNKQKDKWIRQLIMWGRHFIDHHLLALKTDFQIIILLFVLLASGRVGWCSAKAVGLHSEDASFKSLPGYQLFWLRFFVAFLSSYRRIPRLVSRVRHDRFLQNLFQFSHHE